MFAIEQAMFCMFAESDVMQHVQNANISFVQSYSCDRLQSKCGGSDRHAADSTLHHQEPGGPHKTAGRQCVQ